MSFMDVLKREHVQKAPVQNQEQVKAPIVEAKETKKPEEVLRGAGFKIKLITPTSFGTQIDFAKQYDPKEIENILIGFNIKLKNKSVFIVN
jgi:hypothetical protein